MNIKHTKTTRNNSNDSESQPIENRKSKIENAKAEFLTAVRTFAPADKGLHQLAERVPADRITGYPQATALKFVMDMYELAARAFYHRCLGDCLAIIPGGGSLQKRLAKNRTKITQPIISFGM
jgi:hypothetical protein